MSMRKVRAAILGFGFVGQGVYNIARERRAEWAERLQVELEVVRVLVTDAGKERRLPEGFDRALLTDRFEDVFPAAGGNPLQVDVVFEGMVGEEPAAGYLRTALERGSSVITANKVMFARYGAELEALAREKQLRVGYEATVAGGVPVIKTLQRMLPVQHVHKIEGILNGTTNFILTDMRLNPGKSYEATLREAQEKGYAEADPYNDVSGRDAFCKLMVLSTLVFGRQPDWDAVKMVGIQDITSEMVAQAQAEGKRYRHVASIALGEDGVSLEGSVSPQLVDAAHSLYGIENATNAVAISTDYLGAVTLVGPGAGSYPTGSAMIEDWLFFEQLKRVADGKE